MTILLTAVLTTMSTTVSTEAFDTPYAVLEAKAGRFFNNREWASAAAMYQLMIDRRPNVADTYARAIVSEGMRGRSVAQMEFFNGALQNRIAFDSLLTYVRNVSFECGSTDLYEKFLHTVNDSHAWMERVVDGYLLDYYSFRCNGPQIVTYSRKMLEGLPDNERYLLLLARGYLLQDDIDKAVDTYRRVIDIHPDCCDALLYLGNYYAGRSDGKQLAEDYLSRAYKLKPTPYVERVLSGLIKEK